MTKFDELSKRAFVKAENTFIWFWANEDTRKWKLYVNHPTYRELDFELEGSDLEELSELAMVKLDEYALSKEKWLKAHPFARNSVEPGQG